VWDRAYCAWWRQMGNRSLHLFAGPSLGATTSAQLETAGVVTHPPARRGDIHRLARVEPGATIAIADGLFHQHPAVGHAEIRDAIRGGAIIWGLCSIGAIRAAEMHHLGVHGFGEVFQAYKCDPELPDDEVALLHFPMPPYVAVSEPMIHWRSYFRVLERTGLLDPLASNCIQADLAGRWYGERTLDYVASLLRQFAGISVELRELDLALQPHRIKQLDLSRFIQSRPWECSQTSSCSAPSFSVGSRVDLDTLGGLPFVDLTFDPALFLSAVAGRRAGLFRSYVSSGPNGYAAMLEPAWIVDALTPFFANADFMPPHAELTTSEKKWAEMALNRVRKNSGKLARLFDLPIRVLRWKSPRVSITNPLIPQTIFLGEGALQSTFGVIEEVWIHEFAHVWLGMLCEVSDLQKPHSMQKHTLPSGTSSKDARGVLLAAHFAAAVMSYLIDSSPQVPLIGRRAERLHYVQWYLRHALQIPITADLTPMGFSVLEKLREFSELH
jgi:hypothetical protein